MMTSEPRKDRRGVPALADLVAPAATDWCLLDNMIGASPRPSEISPSNEGEIKPAATKRGGSATIAPETKSRHAARAPSRQNNGGRRFRRPPCPFAGTWPGRQGVPRRAVSSDSARTGGPQRRFLRGPFPAEAGAGFPAGSPTRAEAL